MPTDSTISHQAQYEEEKYRIVMVVWEWAKDHLWLAAILVVLYLLIKYVIVPALQKHGELLAESCANRRNRRAYSMAAGDKQISTLSTPLIDSRYISISMPKVVENVVSAIENAESGIRNRCCVVCSDKGLAKHYATLFYKRMEQADVVDHIGWVNYQKPRDQTLELCTEHCLFYDLSLCGDIDSVEKRVRAQFKHFQKTDVHTLLVFWMEKDALEDDNTLRQIAALDGLSVILFATAPVSGYENVVIPEEGGIIL